MLYTTLDAGYNGWLMDLDLKTKTGLTPENEI